MALPIAVTVSPILKAYGTLPGTVTILDGTGSFDPDGTPIDAYLWTIYSKPPGSAAALVNPATATPSITPDLPGTYLVFLRVQSGGEWSEAAGPDAPDSAWCAVVVTTRFEAIRIPAAGERNWSASLYDALIKFDAAAGLTPGGPAPSLQTTGSPVDVASAAPPAMGDVLTATDATHATWQAPAAATPPTVYFPVGKYGSAAAGSPGAAGRIRCGVLYIPPMTITKLRWYLNSYGTLTERMDIGLYDLTGALVAHTGIFDPSQLNGPNPPASPDSKVYETALASPLVWNGGNLLLAWTNMEGNASVWCISNEQVPYKDDMDPLYGYPAETSATGELPAAITLPLAHPDRLFSVLIWIAALT